MFVRGDRYSIAVGISQDGYVRVGVVEGSYDAATFFDYIAENIVSACLLAAALRCCHRNYLPLVTANEPMARRAECSHLG